MRHYSQSVYLAADRAIREFELQESAQTQQVVSSYRSTPHLAVDTSSADAYAALQRKKLTTVALIVGFVLLRVVHAVMVPSLFTTMYAIMVVTLAAAFGIHRLLLHWRKGAT